MFILFLSHQSCDFTCSIFVFILCAKCSFVRSIFTSRRCPKRRKYSGFQIVTLRRVIDRRVDARVPSHKGFHLNIVLYLVCALFFAYCFFLLGTNHSRRQTSDTTFNFPFFISFCHVWIEDLNLRSWLVNYFLCPLRWCLFKLQLFTLLVHLFPCYHCQY